MTIRDIKEMYKDKGDDLVFIRTDTLVERLRRLRALNTGLSNTGVTRRIWNGCVIEEAARTKKKRF
ncbi:MAG: hypothetical protein ISS34_01270 [Candidatus Omnitrophica bacterium]|nr:hypothetical protein [Candidatus Omnitrophota bacterium]